MLIDRIYLRNYRVFERELDLVVPPGLVGVYGPNGAGKSTLLEAILWVLWGRTRTSKDEVRSAGAHGESVAEVTFEHEGHIYVVRRTVTGASSMVRAQAQCDGLAMAEGVRDTARYVHSVLGMDDAAFRSSVFAEQKQLTAFSSQSPAERRKLVLSLLGVTPLDTARDRARSDARQAATDHDHLRRALPDLAELEMSAADAAARASALALAAQDEANAAQAARDIAAGRQKTFTELDLARQEYDKLVLEGRAARSELDGLAEQAKHLKAELDSLDRDGKDLAGLRAQAAGLEACESTARFLATLDQAARELAGHPELPPPAPTGQDDLQEASTAVMAARSALGAAQARDQAAKSRLEDSTRALSRTTELSPAGECPLCGQALGEAFAQVLAHREQDQAEAAKEAEAARASLSEAAATASDASRHLDQVSTAAQKAQAELAAWESSRKLREAAAQRVEGALGQLAVHDSSLAGRLGPSPSIEAVSAAGAQAEARLQAARAAAAEAQKLSGRLERRPEVERLLAGTAERLAGAESAVAALRDKVKALHYDPVALQASKQALQEAEATSRQADGAASAAALEATKAQALAGGEAKRVDDARHQHGQLAALESQSLHLQRASDLLGAFRNTVVASVGPRLAVQAADLFAELTDNEYDRLEVDADTYGLKICDAGISYQLDRFSGSEVDLANLAMRVAIGEHVRLLSGGMVGLLVLDEVFGPLDEERRARMLMALERLRGRFRQVLVVTHSIEVKEQLPNAIEVVKLPGRRATARLLGN